MAAPGNGGLIPVVVVGYPEVTDAGNGGPKPGKVESCIIVKVVGNKKNT